MCFFGNKRYMKKIIIYDRDIMFLPLAYITCRSNKDLPPLVAHSNCHSHNLFSWVSPVTFSSLLCVMLFVFMLLDNWKREKWNK